MSKTNTAESTYEVGSHDLPSFLYDNGTVWDQKDMDRMGKKQELKRNFRLISIIGFISILQATWESALLTSSFGLLNGGTAGTIWLTIAVWICVMAMIASMAEMASMAPTAGGQYHWVSEFAPRSFQRPLSYIVGWCVCLGWVSGIPGCGQLLTGLVQGMVLLVKPDANLDQLWQATLLIFAVLMLTFAFNIFLNRYLPIAETTILAVHATGFIIFLSVLFSMSDLTPAKEVFTVTHNGGGWDNIGMSTLVGIASPLWFFVGPDSSAHLSEEIVDAGLVLPRAMIWATFVNGILGITMLIAFCFCISDIDAVLNGPTGVPIVEVLYNSTHSVAGTCILVSILVLLTFFSTVSVIAAASRSCWAFARDGGFPFSTWITRVHPRWHVPVNALLLSLGVSVILAAINFGSDVALNAIISVSNAALVFSYIISIGCIRWKRFKGEPLLPRRWSLGTLGSPINDAALVFLVVSFIFSFFPQSPSVGDPEWAVNFNWAVVMFSSVCLMALCYYFGGGRRTYVPPVNLVKIS